MFWSGEMICAYDFYRLSKTGESDAIDTHLKSLPVTKCRECAGKEFYRNSILWEGPECTSCMCVGGGLLSMWHNMDVKIWGKKWIKKTWAEATWNQSALKSKSYYSISRKKTQKRWYICESEIREYLRIPSCRLNQVAFPWQSSMMSLCIEAALLPDIGEIQEVTCTLQRISSY